MNALFYVRSFRSPNGVGLALFQPSHLNSWQTYIVLSIRPRQRRILLRLPHHLFGFSWWPPRFLTEAALRAQ